MIHRMLEEGEPPWVFDSDHRRGTISVPTRLLAEVARLEQRIADALFDPLARTPLGSEIRSHVKNLTDENRWELVSALAGSGKKVDVAAVALAGPGYYLSGLSDEAHATLRMAADRFAPTDHRQFTATRAVIDRVGQAGGPLFAAFVKVRDKSQGPVAQAHAAIRSLG